MHFKFLLLTPAFLFAEIGYVEPWGKDAKIQAEHIKHQKYSEPPIFTQLVKGLISFHQKHLSKTTGPRSHFRPSSSQYTMEAIQAYGLLKGWLMGCDRIMRENADPWIYSTKKFDKKWYKWDPPVSKEKKQPPFRLNQIKKNN